MSLRQPKSTIGSRDRIPFDLAAAERMPGWRDGFAWPLPHPEIYEPVMGFMRRVIAAADNFTDEDLRDVLLICLPRMTASAATLIESALWVQAAERTGLEIEGGPEAIYRLKGEEAPDAVEFTKPSEAHRTPLRWPLPRRLARIKSWTPLPRLPLALLNPHAEAISHNSLLRVCARSKRIGYRHADLMLPPQSAAQQPMQTRAMQVLTELLADAMEGTEELTLDRRELAISLIRDEVTAHIEDGVRLMAAARQIRTLPRAIWAGTGGYKTGRSIRIEARPRRIPAARVDKTEERRGGEERRSRWAPDH